eukprot:scaffold1762_cov383-Prasinococcus_capsulatus_cf.AAC.3
MGAWRVTYAVCCELLSVFLAAGAWTGCHLTRKPLEAITSATSGFQTVKAASFALGDQVNVSRNDQSGQVELVVEERQDSLRTARDASDSWPELKPHFLLAPHNAGVAYKAI